MAQNFALPISAQSTPAVAGNGGGFGQPSGVSIGPASGGFGGVAGTHPGSTFQAVNNPREQVRFQVQPQVTIVVKPVFPLPESSTDSNGARRKDFLMTVNNISTGNQYDPEAVDLNKYRFQGQVVCTLQQANVFLEKIAREGVDEATGGLVDPKSIGFSEIEMYMYKKFSELANATGDFYETSASDSVGYVKRAGVIPGGISARGSLLYPQAGRSPVRAASIPELVCEVFHPLGVYNSRGTHNAMEQFSGKIPHNNVNNMLGVNISNYSFMRDIWGVPMRAGDLLELVAYAGRHPSGAKRNDGVTSTSTAPRLYHTGNGAGAPEDIEYVQFQPMCGLQYCQIEDFYTNDAIGVIPAHSTFDGRDVKVIKEYKDSTMHPPSGDLFVEVDNIAGDTDISNGYGSTSYTKDFLTHVFASSFVRLPIARLWVAPLHQPFMHKKALPIPYKQDFNMVGYNAGKSDAEASLDSDWVLPNQNVGNLIYNKSKEFHNIEVELLCSHMELF